MGPPTGAKTQALQPRASFRVLVLELRIAVLLFPGGAMIFDSFLLTYVGELLRDKLQDRDLETLARRLAMVACPRFFFQLKEDS